MNISVQAANLSDCRIESKLFFARIGILYYTLAHVRPDPCGVIRRCKKNVGEKAFLNVKTLQNTENARRCLLLSYVRYWKRENKNERLKRDDKRHSHVAVK